MEKCVNCGKPEAHHNARGKYCPIGQRHRTMGYTQYSHTMTYDAHCGPLTESMFHDYFKDWQRGDDIDITQLRRSLNAQLAKGK